MPQCEEPGFYEMMVDLILSIVDSTVPCVILSLDRPATYGYTYVRYKIEFIFEVTK